jgi:anti-sigma regulatory factor (Ser/Thr protein kinase)
MVARATTVVSRTIPLPGNGLRPVAARGGTGTANAPASWSGIITMASLGMLRRSITLLARQEGLTDEPLAHFVLAVQELMTNALRHGGGWGRVRLCRDGDRLTCTVIDHGPGFTGDLAHCGESLLARSEGGRGLFLARRLTESFQVSSRPARTVVTVTVQVPGRPGA